ncbi:MAG: ABC transporter permease [Firmicutes bacterium]|nr:ABC transporter permease [Bacillota bacterium]
MSLSHGSSVIRPVVRSLKRQKSGLVGIIIISLVCLSALLADHIGYGDPNAIMLQDRLCRPMDGSSFGFHPLGTDGLGRDIFTRIVFGARISLAVSISGAIISAIVGVTAGLLAGYYGGWLDAILMRIADIQLAFPFILLALTLLATLGSGLWQMIMVLGLGRWVSFARVVRGETLSIREREFIEASRAIGNRDFWIIFRHILPNIFAPVIIVASFAVASNVLSEASLSFLGLGVDLAIPTWGMMLAEGREYLPDAWWLATFPGLAILITVLGINLFGDWLRDYLDPKLKL